MFKKILVPLDGSVLSEQILPLAKELLGAGAEEATLLAVAEPPGATVRRRKAGRPPVPLAALPGAYPRTVIPSTPPRYLKTRDQAVDLIVMATHGRSGLSERLHGSVTAEVLSSGVAPLLAVQPNERRARPNR